MPTSLFFHESWHGPNWAQNTIITYLSRGYNHKQAHQHLPTCSGFHWETEKFTFVGVCENGENWAWWGLIRIRGRRSLSRALRRIVADSGVWCMRRLLRWWLGSISGERRTHWHWLLYGLGLICCGWDLGQNRDTCFIGGLLFCEQSDIISIREVLLVMLYRLVSSLYQVDSLAAHSDNQHITETLNAFNPIWMSFVPSL